MAQALKLLAIRHARSHGARRLVTRINADNALMLAINDKLGFQREPGFYHLVQKPH